MANRLVLKLYVASAVKGERSLAKTKLLITKPVQKFLLEHAPRLLENLEESWESELLAPGKNKLLVALDLTNKILLHEIIPVVAANAWARVELVFSDSVITNAFKNKRIDAWAESNFCRRSGGAILEYSEQWSRLHWLVTELGAEVCYTPLEDKTMTELLSQTRQLV